MLAQRVVFMEEIQTLQAPARSAPSLRFRWLRLGLKSARVCKSAPSGVGECPPAKGAGQKKTILPCPVQNRIVATSREKQTSAVFLRPPGEGWFALEDSFLWKLAFPDSSLLHSLPTATSGATWLFPQGRGSLETLLDSRAAEGQAASYLPLTHSLPVSFPGSSSSL